MSSRGCAHFLALAGASMLAGLAGAEPARTNHLRVLLLGDRQHHRPAERFKQIEPALDSAGIRWSYTESLADLGPANLAGYDAIAIYANQENLPAAQEQSLLSFVAHGGGLVAIHCASYCFLNSTNYLALVGARFKSHGTGEFEEKILQPNHPVFEGVQPIKSWDETYVHEKHNPDRQVLAERVDGAHHEPYTWVRESGRGRVFYTAWGHDERTWGNPNFQRLLLNAISWTTAQSPNRLEPRAGLPPFAYTNSSVALPNYLAGAKWGTEGAAITNMQAPLAPAESLKHFALLPGFRPSLFAAEPEITKPICMQWDARGRLWIAETIDYPNSMQPMGEGHDRIKICEDTNGDGTADKFTVFADKLSIPSGFVFYKDGIIVAHSGLTEFLRDTNNDSYVDVRTVLFKGWGTQDTHAGPSNLRYGFDNWIYGTVGYSGFDGIVAGKQVRFGQGFFRFKPDGSALEFIRASNNNTWGIGLTEDNLLFGSTANNNASMFMPIPNRYYEAVRGWSAARLESIADSQEIFPITEKVRQVDWHSRYTAGAGSAIYTARQFPSEYWNRVQFVAEPTGHLLGKFHLEPRRADFIAHNGRSFLASDDEWTSPICAEVGPDGALWVIDWYNYIIQHNPTPIGFQKGKGNAYETAMRDKLHGRIYRIVYGTSPPAGLRSLSDAAPGELVNALKSDNLFWRLTAQRLLVEKRDATTIPGLCALVADPALDQLGLNPGALHALWTLHGLGAFATLTPETEQVLRGGMKHPSAAVRRAAVSVLPRTTSWLAAITQLDLLRDPDPHVRLATLLAASEMPADKKFAQELCHAMANKDLWSDRWLTDAATCAAAANDFEFLAALLGSPQDSRVLPEVTARVATHFAMRGSADSALTLIGKISSGNQSLAAPVLQNLAAHWPANSPLKLDPASQEMLRKLMSALDVENETQLLVLARKWGHPDLFPQAVERLAQPLRESIANPSLSASARAAAASDLLALADDLSAVRLILAQVDALTAPDLSSALLNALGKTRAPGAGQAMVAALPQLTPAARKLQLTILLRRPEWIAAVLDAVEHKTLSPSDLATEQWSQLRGHADSRIADRATALAASAPAVSKDRADIVRALLPAAALHGDAALGRAVFATNCSVCHTFNGQGGKVGPDLTGIGARDRKEVLTDILDPNRSVEANYRLWNVTTAEDETFSGRLDSETQTSIELLDAAGQKHVFQRKDIRSLKTSGLSIMPNGFEALAPNDLASLLDYLATTKR
jgi:putative membrane-bound dehydrogenase-like protein